MPSSCRCPLIFGLRYLRDSVSNVSKSLINASWLKPFPSGIHQRSSRAEPLERPAAKRKPLDRPFVIGTASSGSNSADCVCREFPAGLGRAAQKPDWLVEGVEFEQSGEFLNPFRYGDSPENPNAHQIPERARNEGSRRFQIRPLPPGSCEPLR